jgi:hypothetical protein
LKYLLDTNIISAREHLLRFGRPHVFSENRKRSVHAGLATACGATPGHGRFDFSALCSLFFVR